MTVGVPKDWASGDAMTAATANAEVRDQFNGLRNRPRARICHPIGGGVSVTASATLTTFTKITGLTEITFEGNYAGVDMTPAAADGLVAPVAGLYMVHGGVHFVGGTTGLRRAVLRKNGTATDLTDTGGIQPSPDVTQGMGDEAEGQLTGAICGPELVLLAALDKVELFASSTAALDTSDFNTAFLELVWMANGP